jgi:hypothetical protein
MVNTVTNISSVSEHPPEVPVTVYNIVEAGDAITEAPDAELNPEDGAQV